MSNAYKEEQQRKRDEALMESCWQLTGTGKRIQTIKEYRSATGCRLKPALLALGPRE